MVFQRPPEGVDPLVLMNCGPFDFPVGREVPFSFCIIFGQDEEDLINNARFAQVMYNSRYQGFTPPNRPNVFAEGALDKVKIYWDDHSESSKDVLTGYSDFEGYKIYKSMDGGQTWGNSQNMIYDRNGIFVGWEPFQQFDLSAEMDSLHCVYENSYDCEPELSRGHSISGQDPYFPWFNLGNDTGLDIIRLAEPYVVNGDTFRYMFEDEDVINGIEYTYAVVSYDMGVEPYYSVRYIDLGNGQYQTEIDTNFSNPNKWADPDGYASIENSKGTTILDRNFVQVYPGVSPTIDLKNVTVVPNPYIGGSKFNESEHSRKIRFTNLTKNCTIKIFTVAGELVTILRHSDESSGNAFWDMRTINNQEVGPGLYIYYIEDINNKNGDSHIGKFAVVR